MDEAEFSTLKRIFNDPLHSAEIIKNMKKLSTKTGTNWNAYLDANPLFPGAYPLDINKKSFTNPYLARYPIDSPNPEIFYRRWH